INVDEHDYEFKKNHVLRFLEQGDKVKATIFFRGREMTHTNLGRQVLERLLKEVGDRAVVEFRPRMEGNTLHAILAPPKKVVGMPVRLLTNCERSQERADLTATRWCVPAALLRGLTTTPSRTASSFISTHSL